MPARALCALTEPNPIPRTMSAPLTRQTTELTYAGARIVLDACIAKAAEMGVPQCVVIMDAGGNLLAFARMDGAKVLSQHSATQKAQTAASIRAATGAAPQDFGVNLALATGGRVTNLKGGLPILIGGQVVGAIGIGSGTGDQDVAVAEAGLAALQSALA